MIYLDMLIVELNALFEAVEFPCTYEELMIQCEKTGMPAHIVEELIERFSEYSSTDEEIDQDSFEEFESYDEEFFGQD